MDLVHLQGFVDPEDWTFLLTGGLGDSGSLANPATDWLQDRAWRELGRLAQMPGFKVSLPLCSAFHCTMSAMLLTPSQLQLCTVILTLMPCCIMLKQAAQKACSWLLSSLHYKPSCHIHHRAQAEHIFACAGSNRVLHKWLPTVAAAV